MEKALISTIRLAEMLDVSTRQIARMRDMGLLPPCVRIGRSVKHKISDIEKWIADGCPNCRPAPSAKRARS